jgi:uncharacterized protein with PIN domain
LKTSFRKKNFTIEFKGKPSVKNIIESIGVPHSEIDLILINGKSVGFGYQMKGGEKISVYPVFESLDVSSAQHLRPKPLRNPKFIVDVNLGKLATKLRLLGFDTLFQNNFEDNEIIQIATAQKRTILTRDKAMLTNNLITHAYWVRNDNPKNQVEEVVKRLQLSKQLNPFTRCTVCNSELTSASTEECEMKLPEDTLKYYDTFWKCISCGKLYWKGSHYKHIQKIIQKLQEI